MNQILDIFSSAILWRRNVKKKKKKKRQKKLKGKIFFLGRGRIKTRFLDDSRKNLLYLGKTSFHFVACNLAAIYQWFPVIDP